MIRVPRFRLRRSSRAAAGLLALAMLGPAITLPTAGQALASVAAAAPAQALYAYPAGAARSPVSCPRSSQRAHRCTLTQALALVRAGGTVLLAAGGSKDPYDGNFTVAAAGTTARAPVTIKPAAGVGKPVLDGDASGRVPCPTAACHGAVLTVDPHTFARVLSVTITGGDNKGVQGGGGLEDRGNVSLTHVTISACAALVGGGAAVDGGASLTVADSKFAGDSATYFGGAIDSGSVVGQAAGTGQVSVTGTTFSDNRAPRGGAIDSGDGGTGTLTVTSSTFEANSASSHGGAIDTADSGTATATVTGVTFADDKSVHGGAIDNADSGGQGTLTVTGSTFSGDSATDGGAIDNAERGHGTVTVQTSTLAADRASAQGAAIDSGNADGTGTFLILNSTIDGSLGRPAIGQQAGSVRVAGTIIAGSEANCSQPVSDGGYNLISSAATACGFDPGQTDLIGVNPRLGPLGKHGGPTATMIPAATSAVLERIPDPGVASFGSGGPSSLGVATVALCPVPDQRGTRSGEAAGCAIGSVDPANTTPVVTSLSSAQGPAAGGGTLTIHGGNFTAGATVRFGAVRAAHASVVSSTRITVTVPALPASDSGLAVVVTVTSKAGLTSPYRALAGYTYYTPDWSAYLDGADHTLDNPGATSITPSSVTNLRPIWQWTPPASTNSGSTFLFASPVVSDNVIYVGLEDGYMDAVSEATRQILWSDFLGIEVPTSCEGGTLGVTSTAAVADDPSNGHRTVYINAPNGYLYALNAATGATEWKSLVGVPGSLTGGPDDYYAWGSPTVANGKVYIGIASNCDLPLVHAGILEISQSTGQRLAYWDSEPANVVGGSVWSSVAALPNGDVAVSTGNSVGNDQIPDGESLVVLDGSTLKQLGAWQIPGTQAIGDSDFGGSPTVFTAYPHGVATTMVGACNKDGIYYALRAYDMAAGPLWERRMGVPTTGPESDECDSAAIWNGKYLIEGGGSQVTLKGTTYSGSVQALNPTTGQPVWATGLPGWVVGSPAEDGGGVIAAPILDSPSAGQTGVFLLSASTGKILDYLSTQPRGEFSEPAFDGNDLLVGDEGSTLPLTEYAITKPGQATPLQVSPGVADVGSTVTLTLTTTGGLTSPADVVVSGTQVEVESVDITSPTTAQVTVKVLGNAQAGASLNVTLTEPDLTAYSCTSCLEIANG
jgi:outer membrane protein assembly factor BamB